MIRSDLKRALTGKGFLIGIAGIVLILLLSEADLALPVLQSKNPVLVYGFHATQLFELLKSEIMTLTLPIFCTLPYTTAYLDDIKSGYIKFYLERSGTKNYSRGKLIACGVSGGLTLAFGLILSYGLSWLIFLPLEAAPEAGTQLQPYLAQMLTKAALLFFLGMFWSLTGFTLAAVTQSRYMAYASPFVFYYLLIILKERYLPWIYVIYPKEWLAQEEHWFLGSFGVMILLTELSAVISIIFIIIAGRRLENV